MPEDKPPKGKRGFASMDPEKLRKIAIKGGQAVPKEKRSFTVNRDLASAAGRKGGLSTSPDKRGFSTNRKVAALAGRKGGLARAKKEASQP